MRITRQHLEAKAAYLNKLMDTPAKYMTDKKINIGHYSISGAYGGYSLHQTMNESGGAREVLSTGHIPARELAALISAYIAGIQEAKQ